MGVRAVAAIGVILVAAVGVLLWVVSRPAPGPSVLIGTAFRDLEPVGLPMLPMYRGQYVLIPTQRLVNTTPDPVTLKQIELVEIPTGWELGATRLWTYESTEGLPAGFVEDPHDPFSPTKVPSYRVEGTVCPPSSLCPYYALTKVTAHVNGDVEFLTSRVTYMWRGSTYQQVLRYPAAVAVVSPGTDLSTVTPTPTVG
jgi:hypothetical protein